MDDSKPAIQFPRRVPPSSGAIQQLQRLFRLASPHQPSRNINNKLVIPRILESCVGIFFQRIIWFFIQLLNDCRSEVSKSLREIIRVRI